MAKHTFGLDKVEIAPLASDGGIGTAWVTVGETVVDSASLTSSAPTTTEFKSEESDAPVDSVVSDPGTQTFKWSSFDVSAATLILLFGGTSTGGTSGVLGTVGTIVGGTGYTNGTYNTVPLLSSVTGTGGNATIVVSGGAITSVTPVGRGSGYTQGETLTISNSNVGGTGSGFSVTVATVTGTTLSWAAPDVIPVLERSIRLTDKKGNVVVIARGQISTTLSLSFSKTKLGQLDMSATVLQPSKSGVNRLTITYA